MRLNEIYDTHKDRVTFFCVYIQEAHPEDGWQVPMNVDDDVVFTAPKTIDERAEIAQACVLRLQLNMPTLLDDMDDAVDSVYAALPDRLYVIDADGAITFKSDPGPWGFDVDSWENAIQQTLV